MNSPHKPSTFSKWLPTPGSFIFTLLIAALLLYTQRANALPGLTIPQAPSATSTTTLPYQGRLTDTNGTPLNGTYSMSFKLYTTSSGGTALWTEEWDFTDSIVVQDGLFNVLLGSLTPIPESVISSNSSLWLGISVETDDEMTPRVQIGSAPFAMQANRAFELSAADGSPQDAVVVDENGSVGVGTTTPLPGTILDILGNIRVNGQLGVGNFTDYLGLGMGDIGIINGGYLKSRNATNDGFVHLIGLNPGTNNIILAQDGGFVGIGTSDPSDKLDIFGNLRLSGGLKSILFSDPGNYDFSIVHNDGVSLDVRSPEYNGGMTIASFQNNGNVGIGTTNPATLLHIESSDAPKIQIITSATSGGQQRTYLNMKDGNNDGWRLRYAGDSNEKSFDITPIVGGSPGISTFTLINNGFVGFGVTPQYPLQMANGAHVTVGGVWTDASDRNLKENFVPIDPMTLLDKVVQMPLSAWNFKTEGNEIKHIGPMAQDFYEAFGVGEDNKHISALDANGVAFAAIQGLNQLVTEQDTKIAMQEQHIADLESRLTALEEAIQLGQPVQVAGMGKGSWVMLILGLVVGGLVVWLIPHIIPIYKGLLSQNQHAL